MGAIAVRTKVRTNKAVLTAAQQCNYGVAIISSSSGAIASAHNW